ncbi:hypothetical protein ACFLV7_10775 [Chloroflexota bacterium]
MLSIKDAATLALRAKQIGFVLAVLALSKNVNFVHMTSLNTKARLN